MYDSFDLWIAAKDGNTAMVRRLLQCPNIDPSFKNNVALRWAAQNGHIDVVKILMYDKRVDVTDFNNYALINALNNKHIEIAILLCQAQSI